MVYKITTQSNVTVNIDKSVYWKQILLALTASLPFFTFGVETNTLSSSAHSGHFIGSPSDVSWSTTALLLGSIVSPSLYCYSIDKFGRKLGIYAIYLTQGISLIPLLLEDNQINDIMLNALAGLSAGGLFTVLPIYVREITRNQIRGLNLSFMMLFTTAGYLMRIAVDLETMIYVMIAMVAFQFVSLLWLLETPDYLVKLKKFKEAHINFAAINCLDSNDEVVTCEINNLKSECERAKSKENLTLIDIFRNQIWRDELKIGIVLQTCMVLCGNILFMDEDKSLSQLGPMTHPDGVLVVSSIFVGSAICFIVIMFLDRRYILTTGHSIMVLSMGVLGVFTQADLTVSSLRWLPVTALILLIIGYGFVWGLPVLVTVEMLNVEIRATVVSFIYVYSQILKLIHVHTFQYIEEYMGIYTIFYIFAGINLYGAVYSLFRIPVIKEKTIRQVEKQLKRIPIV